MAGLTNDQATERAVAVYQVLVNLNAISEESARPVGAVVDSPFNPIPPPDGGWAAREDATRAATSWLRTAVRLGYVGAVKGRDRRWRYWARSA